MPEDEAPSSAQPDLHAAVRSFLAWADEDGTKEGIDGLRPLPVLEQLGPGALLGDFELVRQVGAGGMGVVFEARQVSVPGRCVAVKVLRTLFVSERTAERFRREIATIGSLDHPGIVPVIAAGVDAGAPYYAMKFLAGLSAAALIRALRGHVSVPKDTSAVSRHLREAASSGSTDDPESPWESSYVRWTAGVGLQMAEALQHAHEHRIVHRDVKPGNVMLSVSGRPVLVDFGLANDESAETLTHAGDFLGTLAYASPEQVRGEAVDTRTDVYSLGATLYELLTLRRPFDAESEGKTRRLIEEEDPPPLPAAISTDLRTICNCALAKSPAQRYATPGAMAHDLRQFLNGIPIRAQPPGILMQAARTMRSYPRVVTAVLVALLAAGGLWSRAQFQARARVGEGLAELERSILERDGVRQMEMELSVLLASQRERKLKKYEALEQLRQDIRTTRSLVNEGYDRAEASLRRAFEYVAGHRGARRALADVFAARLEASLYDLVDVYDPESLEVVQASLRSFDEAGRHADLLDGTGSFELTSDPPGAQIEIWRDLLDGGLSKREFEGHTPYVGAGLQEGSYVALLRMAGRSVVRVPFLVRRGACYEVDGAMPPRELSQVHLPPREGPEGFLYVAPGWTLVEDDPPRWEFVEGFWMQRDEVTSAEHLSWMNGFEGDVLRSRFKLDEPLDPDWKPRVSDAEFYVQRASEGGLWVLADSVNPRAPVRGLSPMEMAEYASYAQSLPTAPPGWYYSLPSVAQWVRAARGADARPYPWGREFDSKKCLGYFFEYSAGANPSPYSIDKGEDVSPFGVRSLAGSISEATMDVVGPQPGQRAVCGGSYRSAHESEMRTTSILSMENERPLPYVGFRLVLQTLPTWMTVPHSSRDSFSDDFERPGRDMGNGWVEVLSGSPLGLPTSPAVSAHCILENGNLVCKGGSGSFSEPATAWHRIHVSDEGWTVSTTLRRKGPGQASLLLQRGFRVDEEHAIQVVFRSSGKVEFSVLCGNGEKMDSQPQADLDRPKCIELRVRGTRAVAHIWSEDAEVPVVLEIELPSGFPAPRFLGFYAQNAGVRLEVEEVLVSPLPH